MFMTSWQHIYCNLLTQLYDHGPQLQQQSQLFQNGSLSWTTKERNYRDLGPGYCVGDASTCMENRILARNQTHVRRINRREQENVLCMWHGPNLHKSLCTYWQTSCNNVSQKSVCNMLRYPMVFRVLSKKNCLINTRLDYGSSHCNLGYIMHFSGKYMWIFCSPKLKIVFVHWSVQVETCLIWEAHAPYGSFMFRPRRQLQSLVLIMCNTYVQYI